MKNIKLPKKDRPNGLNLYCTTHKRWFADDSKITTKCKKCALKYKAKIHVPGTKRESKIKTFEAESFEEALLIFHQFKKKLKETNFHQVNIKEDNYKPILLKDCMNEFMNYKKDIGVPAHLKKNLPKKNIDTAKRCLQVFANSLLDNGIEVDRLKFGEINSKVVGFTTEYMLGEKKKYSNRTFNNAIANINSFMRYIIKEHYSDFKNPFAEVPKLPVEKHNYMISKREFLEIVNLVKPENLIQISETTKKKKHLYRSWLIDGYYLGLLCGGRTEEPVNMRWSDIKLNPHGRLSFISVTDFKRTRASFSLGKVVEIKKKVEMTPELEKLLYEMGYEEKKGSNDYILAPDAGVKRITVAISISTSFNFLLKKMEMPEKKFKHLRKTYATNCYLADADNFYKLMGHTNPNTTMKHYVNMDYAMEIRRQKLFEQKEKERGKNTSF